MAVLAALLAVFVPVPAHSATPAASAPRASVGAGWPTYHHDSGRSGYDQSSPAITASGPYAQWNTPLDGAVYAEPLVWNGMVIAATQNDTIYALDETTGTIVWQKHVATAVSTSYCSSEINPIGIHSTPVIDTANNVVYAVGLVDLNPPNDVARYRMFALHLSDGSPLTNFPVDIVPTVHTSTGDVTLTPSVSEQRAALGMANGHVYVTWGGWSGDCGDYHPWVVGVNATSGVIDYVYEPQNSTQREAGIWGASGPAFDGLGNVYVATGNGGATSCSGTYDHGNGVFRLSPALAELNAWKPSNWCTLSAQDQDVGSIGPAMLNGGVVFQSGKSAEGWMLSNANLAQLNSSTPIPGCIYGSAVFGGTAYLAPRLYVPCDHGDQLIALNVKTTPPYGFSVAWHTTGFKPEPPIVAGGLVWSLAKDGARLFGFDAATGGLKVSVGLTSSVRHFSTPTADGGWIFVPQNTSVSGFNFVYPPSPPPNCGNSGCHIYTLDGLGGIHPAGNSPSIGQGAYWPGWDIARGIALFGDGSGGYQLDGYGGVHPIGSTPAVSSAQNFYFGFDIARSIVADPSGTVASPKGGWVLDGYGGIHEFGGAAHVGTPVYWAGWDIARGLVILSTSPSPEGYVLDGYGGIHPFGGAPAVSQSAYWAGWDIARGIALVPGTSTTTPGGYVLDGLGGLHQFGSAPARVQSAYWPGYDIARGITMWDGATAGNPGGWVMDGLGGLHLFGSAPYVAQGAYWPGWDIGRGVAGEGQGTGNRHYNRGSG